MKMTLGQLGVAGLSGLLLASLWEPFAQSGNVWFALVPLLLLLRGKLSLKRALLLGWVTGFVSWCFQLGWMLVLAENGGPWPMIIPALLGLSAVLAVYVGVFAVAAVFMRRLLPMTPGWGRILAVVVCEPMLWAGTECLRAHLFSGFAWNPLSLATTQMLPVTQLAAIGGSCLVSALVVAVNGAIASIIERFWWSVTHRAPTLKHEKILLSAESSLAFVLLLAAFLFGTKRINTYDQTPKKRDAVAIVQHTDLPCRFQTEFLQHETLWQQGERNADVIALFNADFWLWPESAIMTHILPHAGAEAALTNLAATSNKTLLLGGMYLLPDGRYYNAAMVFTASGLDSKQMYAKRHLVPFGEYFPFDKTFPVLQRLVPSGVSCEPGAEVKTIRLPSGLTVGPLICFEDTVAKEARTSVLDGAELLVNMSNDAWYAPSAEPAQHAQQAILRCIETGVPMMRSTNQGVNTVIDAVGRSQVIEPGSFPTRVKVTEKPFSSFYLTWGEMVFGAPCTLFLLALLFLIAMGRCKVKSVAALLVAFCVCGFPSLSFADQTLLPTSEMALDDGNASLAERTAQTVLTSLGLAPEERAKAEEVLIRLALKKGAWDEALAKIDACPELPAERRLVFTLAALCGKKEYSRVLQVYDEARISADNLWGVTALRYSLLAAQETGKKLLAAERFAAVQAASAATDQVKAENALEWNAYSPNDASRKALLVAAEKADQGGIFLTCALALPKAFAAFDKTPALDCLKATLALKGLSSAITAQLALAAVELADTEAEKITFARQAVTVARETIVRQKALHALGSLLCKAKQTFEEGLGLLKQAVALDPSTEVAPQIQLKIAEALHAYGDSEEALKAYNRYLESYDLPAYAITVRQGKGRLLVAMGRFDEALAVFVDAADLATVPEQHISLMLEGADAATAAKRYPRAIELYRQLLREGARAGIPLKLARCLEDAGQLDAAIKEYQTVRDDAFSAEQDVYTAAMRLAGIQIKAKRYTDAISEYTNVLRRLKQDTFILPTLLERGRTYYRMDNLQSALEDFQKVEPTDSPCAEEARFFLVLCLYRLGEDARARSLAEAYMCAYPNSVRIPDVVLWLAKSDFNQGDYVAAQKGFENFVERWPTDVRVTNALYLAARAAYLNQNYSEAVERVSHLAQLAPDDKLIPDARFLQAEALVELARHAEARDLLDALIRRYPNASWIAEAYGLRGDCLAYTAIDDPERYALALTSYQEAILRLEDDLDVSLKYLFRIGRVLERQNQRDEAAEQYTKLIYRVLNCPEISATGKQWFQKALTRLRSIEMARGNMPSFELLLYRVQRAKIPGVELP